MIVAFLALQASLPTVSTDALKSYLVCVRTKAVGLVPSGEPAEVVAGVAQRSCDDKIEAAADYVETKSRDDPVIAEHDRLYGRRVDPGIRQQLLESLRTAARQSATDVVVQVRADLRLKGIK